MLRSPPPHLASRKWHRDRAGRAGRTGGAGRAGGAGRVMIRWLGSALVAIATVALSANQTSAPAADAAFASFFHARTPREAAAASDQIVGSGVGFDEAFGRLRQGRVYSRDVSRGIVQGSYRS